MVEQIWISTSESLCTDVSDSAFNRFPTFYQPGYQPLHPTAHQAAAELQLACSSNWQNKRFFTSGKWSGTLAPRPKFQNANSH
jgi:hypothetical protein